MTEQNPPAQQPDGPTDPVGPNPVPPQVQQPLPPAVSPETQPYAAQPPYPPTGEPPAGQPYAGQPGSAQPYAGTRPVGYPYADPTYASQPFGNQPLTRPQGVPPGQGYPQYAVPSPPKRSGSKGAIVAICAVLAVLLAAGITTAVVLNHRADLAAAERKAAAEAKAEEERLAQEEAEKKAAEEEAALAEAKATYRECADELGALSTVLNNIDARLDVGLNQGDLSNMLGKASIAYNRINIDNLGEGACLSAGAKLESAFNAYNKTVSAWNDCIYDYYCSVDDDVLPGMQLKWSKASGLIEQADRLLATMDPASPTYDDTAFGSGGTGA